MDALRRFRQIWAVDFEFDAGTATRYRDRGGALVEDRMQRRMMLAYKCGHLDLPDEQAEHISFDFVIKRLLRHFHEHRARRAKRRPSAKNRKGV